MPLQRADVVSVYRAFHDREPDAPFIAQWTQADSIGALVRALRQSERSPRHREHNGARFLAPRELQVTPTPLKRVLLAGHCLLERWPRRLQALGVAAEVDHVLLGAREPPVAPHPASAYSFQVTHIANRMVFGDYELFAWIRAGFGASAASEALFNRSRDAIDRALKTGAAWRDQLPVFVTTLIPPQQEFNGRLIDQRGLDSVLTFIERLNAHLREAVAALDNVYVLDVNEIIASIGRRRLLDDTILVSSHASVLTDGFHAKDRQRFEPPDAPTQVYDIDTDAFLLGVWGEVEAMFRSLRQIDAVKMVCVDLDDTLWRGVLAEEAGLDDIDPDQARAGWPLGVIEALAILKRRGVLLCMVSKNSEARVRAIFDKVYRNLLSLDDFAILKINWAPKTENIREAMAEANLLPRSVVFLDDNPVERAAVKQAFPDIRVIEAPLYYWRRILLWSAETQPPVISSESARRTEMVQAQVRREALRAETGHEDFLAGLDLRVSLAPATPGSKRFERALELVNKSNQFNTTGRRWSAQELAAVDFIAVAAVSDRFTDYGDVFVALVRGDRIEQIVMSCRVISLGVEIAGVAAVAAHILSHYGAVAATVVETDANILARDLFARCGWSLEDGEWRTAQAGAAPSHVKLDSAL